MEPYDAGTAIILPAHTQKKVFNVTTKEWDDTDFDPSPVPTVTVLDPTGAATSPPVTDANMTKSDAGVTGYWHYILQTLETWANGLYRVRIKAIDGSYAGIEIEYTLELKNSTA